MTFYSTILHWALVVSASLFGGLLYWEILVQLDGRRIFKGLARAAEAKAKDAQATEEHYLLIARRFPVEVYALRPVWQQIPISTFLHRLRREVYGMHVSRAKN
jgi:hypothetical protein